MNMDVEAPADAVVEEFRPPRWMGWFGLLFFTAGLAFLVMFTLMIFSGPLVVNVGKPTVHAAKPFEYLLFSMIPIASLTIGWLHLTYVRNYRVRATADRLHVTNSRRRVVIDLRWQDVIEVRERGPFNSAEVYRVTWPSGSQRFLIPSNDLIRFRALVERLAPNRLRSQWGDPIPPKY